MATSEQTFFYRQYDLTKARTHPSMIYHRLFPLPPHLTPPPAASVAVALSTGQ